MSLQGNSTGATARLRYTAATHVGGALLTDVVVTETLTGLASFTPRSNNMILDVRYEVDPGAATPMALFTRRSADVRKLLGTSPDLLPTFTGNQRAGFPIGLKAGFFQIVEQQMSGTLAASDPFAITLARPLDV